ncbi:MAG: hypothetical protein CO012_06110 [Syntrophobacterales bacterium CG_4_8_14_3_um_filter_49_14]|nr:MAG: hypothetical protein COX16_02480 [Deltaproteobacteria bacterium CG23_combo_of_CG06-09_8_20_14_all_51_20]PJC74460.1 MAG: hypothetical protein CO012_06110 [Syntrophobacterales bacterium CG_4_8_14_3_um_filter_49_14]
MRSILNVFSITGFVNIILAVCVAFFVPKSIDVWSERGGGVKITQAAAQKTKNGDIKKVTREKMPPEVAYEVVTNKNLFSPNRTEFVETEKDAEQTEEDIRRKIVLYGVVMTDKYSAALISNPEPKFPQRPFLWVKKGNSIGGSNIVVSSIKKENITLRKGTKTYKVLLYDKEKIRKRAVARQQEKPAVVMTQPGAIEKPPAPAAKPGTEIAAPAAKPESKIAAPPEEGEYEIINTPFGKIKRKKK